MDVAKRDEYQRKLLEREDARKKLGNLMGMDRLTRSQVAEERQCRKTIGRVTRWLQEEGVLDQACLLTPAACRLELRIM